MILIVRCISGGLFFLGLRYKGGEEIARRASNGATMSVHLRGTQEVRRVYGRS